MIWAAGWLAATLVASHAATPLTEVWGVLQDVCAPYVLDHVSEEELARRHRLHRRLELPDPFGGPAHNGRGYDGVRGVPNIRLNDEQVLLMPGVLSRRSCSFTLKPEHFGLQKQLSAFIARSPVAFADDTRFDPLTPPNPRTRLFCARGRSGVWLVDSIFAGRETIALGAAPSSSAMCGAAQ